jgi:hypothetical protein
MEEPMRKFFISAILLTMALSLFPLMTYADTTDECDRVGILIDNAGAMIDRATPIILNSGNRQAISLLNEAVDQLHAAQRAYNNNLCRMAFNHANSAINLVRRALGLIHRTNSY